MYLGVFRYIWVYLGVFGYISVYLGKRSRPKKTPKSESNAKLSNLSRMWIGDQCDHWNELSSVLRVKTNAEVAKIRFNG